MQKVNARRPISRVLSSTLPPMDDHSSGTPITGGLTRPTRTTTRKRIFRRISAVTRTTPEGRPYLVLLQVGFTLPTPLPASRCALTAPFHPYRRPPRIVGRRPAVCFLWHCPWGRPRRELPGTLPSW